MPFDDSPRGLLVDAVPDGDEDTTVDVHLALLLSKIEPWLVLYAPDPTTATTSLAPLKPGMLLVTPQANVNGTGRVYVRLPTNEWLKIFPTRHYGSAAPNAALMDVGDFYLQHA